MTVEIKGPCSLSCCGGELACPDSVACESCDSTYTVTISGFSTRYAAMNGDHTVTRSTCTWSASGTFETDCAEGWSITLDCSDSKWYISIELFSWGEPGSGTCNDICSDTFTSDGESNITNCPALGSYSMSRDAFSDGCDSIPTVVLS